MTALDKVSISARYESQVSLKFKTSQDHDDFGLTTDGATNHRDLPAVLALGATYDVTSKFKVMADYNYYFRKMLIGVNLLLQQMKFFVFIGR
ncbi:MAG: hypothetical protein IPH33_04330 [Bacteroidetes bacterium]|nr:hypothetical protein [Bacteroidota bacterium]